MLPSNSSNSTLDFKINCIFEDKQHLSFEQKFLYQNQTTLKIILATLQITSGHVFLKESVCILRSSLFLETIIIWRLFKRLL